MNWLSAALEDMVRTQERIEAEEKARLLPQLNAAIQEFGPHLIDTCSEEDSSTFKPLIGRRVRLVYVGEFTTRSEAHSEPYRLFEEKTGHKVILYYGEDGALYTYELHSLAGESLVLGFRRVNLDRESKHRLDWFHELLIQIGLY